MSQRGGLLLCCVATLTGCVGCRRDASEPTPPETGIDAAARREIAAKGATHSVYVMFEIAEGPAQRELLVAIVDCIQRFGVPPPLVQRG